MPVIERYSGVMFKAIDYDSLNLIQKNNFDISVLFVDGLFGLLRPQDMIPNYKLKITSKVDDLNITKYWQENLKEILLETLKGKIVIDLLPQAQRKVLIPILDDLSIIKINFFEFNNGVLKNSGHNSKQLKGDIIRYITDFDNISVSDISNFKHSQGYSFDKSLSSKNELIFLKQ